MSPAVSVIMTVFNGEAFLRPAINSVLTQTFEDWELIVVDDASTDSTPGILGSYHDPRIKILRYELNRKPGACANSAIAVANGKYIARLDADDNFLPARLEEQLAYMEAHPEVVLVASAAHEINERGERIGYRPGGISDGALKLTLAAYNPIIHSAVMFRTDVARALNCYREEKRYWFSDDFEFWSRMVFRGKAEVLSQPLIEYRVHSSSVSSLNMEDQDQNGEFIARAYAERMVGHALDDSTWSAWRRFVLTKPGRSVAFEAREVRALRLLVSEMIKKTRHDRSKCPVQRLWAKHALALAFRRGNHLSAGARFGFSLMALTLAR